MKIYKLVFSPIEVNTYILADKSGDCAIIDCGCYDEEEFEELDRFIESKKLNPVLVVKYSLPSRSYFWKQVHAGKV